MILLVFLAIAFVSFMYLSYTLIEFFIGFRLLKNLRRQKPLPPHLLPKVSIILSALNEEDYIERTLRSLLAVDYPQLEIIAVNDRSTDRTGEIMAKLQAEFSRLRILTIHELPSGWMGKNHALSVGAKEASGEWLLFTDADVMIHPETMTRTISYCLERKVDHLTIQENHLRNTFGLKILMLGHYLTYSLVFRPWRVRYKWCKKAIGHGAFNLVNASVYRSCGGHQAIALQCLDDMQLGALIKSRGFKQDTVDGCDYLQREWYTSLPQMIKGFEKNAFAVYNYNSFPIYIDTFATVLLFIWPIIALFICGGLLWWLNAVNVVLTLLISARSAYQYRLPIRYVFLYPVAIILLLYTVWNSMRTILRNKGIIWGGTHYPLAELKSRNVIG